MITINLYLAAYIALYLLSAGLALTVDKLNARHLEKYGNRVPDAFKGIIDSQELSKISRYTLSNIRFTWVRTSTAKFIFVLIILFGIPPWLSVALAQINFIPAGLIFFAILGLMSAIVELPFDFYHSFIIEERFGFNTKTYKIWFLDLAKSVLLLAVLGGILLTGLLLMIRYTGNIWWIWAWTFFMSFQLLMTVLYPTVIAPMFNKFIPLENSDLKKEINQLVKASGFYAEGIYQMDATRRTRHSNAYFSGMGKAKRIVLFDSLITSHSQDEILAIVAHEIGHLKKNHIKKQIIITAVVSLFLFYITSKLIISPLMYTSFGFQSISLYAGLFLVGVIWEPVSFFLSPFGMAISRKFEREADLYALRALKTAKPLSMALKKMAAQNLANLQPHPLYVLLNYSHPPFIERIEHLERADTHHTG
jgi:STE24 endopeptidase